jgi:hypothetical protein
MINGDIIALIRLRTVHAAVTIIGSADDDVMLGDIFDAHLEYKKRCMSTDELLAAYRDAQRQMFTVETTCL